MIDTSMEIPFASFHLIGAKFGCLKDIWEIYLSDNFLKFVEKAFLSLHLKGKFKKQDNYKRSLLYYTAMGNCTQLLYYLLQTVTAQSR